jgi:malate dehydrogenase (oxaloacetate-decarboxylating)
VAPNPSAQFSVNLRIETPAATPEIFGKLAAAIGAVGGDIAVVSTVSEGMTVVRDVAVNAGDAEQAELVVAATCSVEGVTLIEHYDRTFHMHEGGKIELVGREPLTPANFDALVGSGVGAVADAIAASPDRAKELTLKRNMVLVVTNGTAVLGLGDIGAAAGMPVMEGKSMLFKGFGDVDSYAMCVDSKDPDEIIATVKAFAPAFGGINLEDISAPTCFLVEDALKEMLDIPVFHDDQHGTAIVTLAAAINACKLTGRSLADLKVVVNGVGASGVACSKILMEAGVTDIIGCDTRGAIYNGRTENMNYMKDWYAENTNPRAVRGTLSEAIVGADLFLGLSGPGTFSLDQLKSMAPDPMVFAMANPVPEIMPEIAGPYVSVMATGRSDYPNQINNVLAFPGIFKGALECQATKISEGMKVAAANAIASVVSDNELTADYIIPSAFNPRVAPVVAAETIRVAREERLARI